MKTTELTDLERDELRLRLRKMRRAAFDLFGELAQLEEDICVHDFKHHDHGEDGEFDQCEKCTKVYLSCLGG